MFPWFRFNADGLCGANQPKGTLTEEAAEIFVHDDLVKRGSKSIEEAFLVGAMIEEVDVQDLDRADLLAFHDNLVFGSERHLNAFVRRYEMVSGKTYVAQLMPPEEVRAILKR